MAEKKKYTEYKNRYSSQNYDSLRVIVPKGRKNDIAAHVKTTGQTINGLVNDLLRGELGMTEEAWGYKRGGESNEVLDD